MTKFRNLEIAHEVANHPHIFVKQSMFGFKTKVYYRPSFSEVDSIRRFYTMASGNAIQHFLEGYVDGNGACKIKSIPLECDDNGNYCLEMCSSRDGEFVAVQLFRYSNLAYNPVSEIIIYEGAQAHVLKKAIEYGEVDCGAREEKMFIPYSQVEEI